MNLFDEFGLVPSSANWIEVRRIRPDESAQHSAYPAALATGPVQARRAGALLLEHVTVTVVVPGNPDHINLKPLSICSKEHQEIVWDSMIEPS